MASEIKRRQSNAYHVNFGFENEAVQSPTCDGDLEALEEVDINEDISKTEEERIEGDSDRLSCWNQCSRGLRFAFIPINQGTYLLSSMMASTFLNKPEPITQTTLSSVGSFEDFWDVLKGPIMEAWYDNKWYNGQPILDNDERLSVRYDNHLIGVPRLRQLRMSNRSCVVPVDFQKDIKECYAPYNMAYEDKVPFGLKHGSAWNYAYPSKLQMEDYFGDISRYSGGGFYEDLSLDRSKAESQVQVLFDNLWLDRGTRAVFIHFTTYNPNLNIFCVVQLLMETPASGAFVVNSEFRSVKLLRYVNTLDYFVLACECIFLVFTLYYIVEEIMEISKHKFSYFTSVWNVLDVVIILLSLVCTAFNIYRTVVVHNTLGELLLEADKFANFQWLSYWQVNFNYGIAIVVFLSWIKLFKYISFNKTMTQLNSTLGNCGKDLAGFSVMFFIVFFSFAELGYLAFGTQVRDFSQFMTSVYTLFRIVLGDFDFNSLERANRVFGPIYFIVYVFFVFFVLLNMFIAIINETYVGVKSDLQNQQNEFDMKDFFKNRMKRMMDRMKKKKSRIEKLQRAIEAARKSGVAKMDVQQLYVHLKESGFADEEIQNVLGRFDSDHDQALSSTEQLKMQAQLEEEKMALVNELAKEEQLALDTVLSVDDEERRQPQVTQSEFTKVLRRVGRIESGMSTIMQHLSTVLSGLNSVEKTKLIRREAMTRLLHAVTTVPSERDDVMEQIVKNGLQMCDETPKDS